MKLRDGFSKEIVFTDHAKARMKKRGATEEEVKKAISKSTWQSSKLGRFECSLEFSFNKEWNEKFYRLKQVVPVFVEEKSQIVVITVYVFYF